MRPLLQLRPFDGQLRVRYRECGQEGILVIPQLVPGNRLCCSGARGLGCNSSARWRSVFP
jgi:hypothetical protein